MNRDEQEPRYIPVVGEEDPWADPDTQFLSDMPQVPENELFAEPTLVQGVVEGKSRRQTVGHVRRDEHPMAVQKPKRVSLFALFSHRTGQQEFDPTAQAREDLRERTGGQIFPTDFPQLPLDEAQTFDKAEIHGPQIHTRISHGASVTRWIAGVVGLGRIRK